MQNIIQKKFESNIFSNPVQLSRQRKTRFSPEPCRGTLQPAPDSFTRAAETLARIIPDLQAVLTDLKTRQPDEFGELPFAKHLKKHSKYFRTKRADEMLKSGFIVDAEDAVRALESMIQRLTWTKEKSEKASHDTTFQGE